MKTNPRLGRTSHIKDWRFVARHWKYHPVLDEGNKGLATALNDVFALLPINGKALEIPNTFDRSFTFESRQLLHQVSKQGGDMEGLITLY